MKFIGDMEIGSMHDTASFGIVEVVGYSDCNSVTVVFLNTGTMITCHPCNVRSGSIRDRNHPVRHGVGFIGEGAFKSSINKVKTRAYVAWNNMITRCYDLEYQKTHTSYIGCSVCEEWHNFQNFALWHEKNYIDGYHLDKDIIAKGNRVYSPQTCMFVSRKDNNIEAHAKSYSFLNPDNAIVNVKNLTAFCIENELNQGHMSAVHRGKRMHHKQWRKL